MSEIELKARELLASCLNEWGNHQEAANVRDGEDLESYEFELRVIGQLLRFGFDTGHGHATRAPQWQPIEFNEDGEPTNVPADTPILVPPTKRLGMTVAKWNPLDGWETETTSEWVGMYRPTHFQPLPAPPEVEG